MTRDRVFSEPKSQIVDFVFDETVAAVFPDMIRRSVPGYELVVPMTGLLAARAIRDSGVRRAYDLGCSLGATTLAILKSLDALGIDVDAAGPCVTGVDNAAPMLEKASAAIDDPRAEFLEADIRDLSFQPAGAITMNWVLQFLPPDARLALLGRIRSALADGGALILSEKIRSEDPVIEAFNFEAHLDFKRANGYSELEISQKRTALEQVMIPDPIGAHLERLGSAGFGRVQVWFQCLNWASFIATP